ncbi:hypothetical protein KUTeg_010950 [Tegillarca granosa]|uniref:Uncharacterized protein n=1 Tax=Tegillarca granosa TaxID=220873 RepID=A0ABQ9F7N6_TEGGR|nr:hypothetical protein KUTeg_010950 [Tegillarca granosa]
MFLLTGPNILAEHHKFVTMDTSENQSNSENQEEKLSKLKNEVHSICEQLSFLGEESMFLSVKLKDASPFFSGSRLGQAFLFEKSEVIGMFYNYCKLYV